MNAARNSEYSQRPNPKLQALAELKALKEASEIATGQLDFHAPRMLVLTGIPGSGKTTFGKMLEDAGWGLRVSQDESGGSRHAVERQVVNALRHGDNVIVDRCNFDRAQRKHWIGMYETGEGEDVSSDTAWKLRGVRQSGTGHG